VSPRETEGDYEGKPERIKLQYHRRKKQNDKNFLMKPKTFTIYDFKFTIG
jgi:hypothetical protein